MDLTTPNIVRRFDPYIGEHIVIMGDRFNEGRKLANLLVSNHVPRVSVLNGGVDAFMADYPTALSQGGLPPL